MAQSRISTFAVDIIDSFEVLLGVESQVQCDGGGVVVDPPSDDPTLKMATINATPPPIVTEPAPLTGEKVFNLLNLKATIQEFESIRKGEILKVKIIYRKP